MNLSVQSKYLEPLWIYRNCSSVRSPNGRSSTRIFEILRAEPKSMSKNHRKCISIRSKWNRHPMQSAAENLRWSQNSRMPAPERKKWLNWNSQAQPSAFATYRWRIDNFFTQKFIFASISIEQAPIHFYVPRVCIRWRQNLAQQPEYRIRIIECIWIRRLMIGSKRGKDDNEKCRRIFTGIDQMGKCLLGITITSQTLSESKPGGQTIHYWSDCEIRFHTLTCIWVKVKKYLLHYSRSFGTDISIRSTYFPLPTNFHSLCKSMSNTGNLVKPPRENSVDQPARNQRIQRRKMVPQSFDPMASDKQTDENLIFTEI